MSEQRIEKLLSDLRELEEDAESNNLRTYDSETWTAWAADVARRAIDALSASPAETGNIGELLQSIGARTSERDQARDCIKILEQRIHELEAAERRTSTYAICENHAPDRWEGDGTCIVCEAQRLWDELTALKKASETSAWRWRSMDSAPKNEIVDFWIVPKLPEECYTDTSGNPITAMNIEPYRRTCKFNGWGALFKAVAWMPLPAPPPSASSTTTTEQM